MKWSGPESSEVLISDREVQILLEYVLKNEPIIIVTRLNYWCEEERNQEFCEFCKVTGIVKMLLTGMRKIPKKGRFSGLAQNELSVDYAIRYQIRDNK